MWEEGGLWMAFGAGLCGVCFWCLTHAAELLEKPCGDFAGDECCGVELGFVAVCAGIDEAGGGCGRPAGGGGFRRV